MSDSLPMSLRSYAKRRGVSAMAVSDAVKRGRLSASVTRDKLGHPKIADPDLADREWDAKTDLSKAPGYVRERADVRARSEQEPPQVRTAPPVPGPAADPAPSAHEGMSLSDASAIEKVWKAKTAELKFKQEAGELIPAAEVRGKVEDVFRMCRTKLLGIPSRSRQALPHLSVADIGKLEELVREALEDLSERAVA